MRGRVSVVTPCFNGARHLRDAIDGALAQTHPDVELVVADDGSTDESVALASSYGPRLRLVRQPNAGPSAARNLALRHATGEFVALLDADDRFHPTKLARQVACLRARDDVGAVYCGWRLVDAQGAPLPERGLYCRSVVNGVSDMRPRIPTRISRSSKIDMKFQRGR